MQIHFSSRLNFKEYLRATIAVALDSWWKISLYFVLVVFTFFNMHILLYKLLFIGCVVVIPLTVFYLAWQNFKKNPLISEELVFDLDSLSLKIKGESFELNRSWNEVYRVSETPRFCFFWITKRLTVPVMSNALNQAQKNRIKEILADFPTVKNDLSREESSGS
jgi:hypothetical protein